MSDIGAVSNDVFKSLAVKKQDSKDNELGKDSFLRLMIAQLQNQDPLSPAKGEDFIAQLAQFSSLEGIQNMNTTLEELSTAFRSSRALEASSLVGRKVQVSSDRAALSGGGSVSGSIQLSSRAEQIQLFIESGTNEQITLLNLQSSDRGELDFTWDGTNSSGLRVEDGIYKIRAVGLVDGTSTELPVTVGANVNSVTIGANDDTVLNVEGVGPVALESVKRFL